MVLCVKLRGHVAGTHDLFAKAVSLGRLQKCARNVDDLERSPQKEHDYIKEVEHWYVPLRQVTMITSVTGGIVSNKTLSTPGYWNLNPIFLLRFVVALKNLLSRSGKKSTEALI
ncbi:hypothetical protein BofuT4_P024890.1 [Botrytis cinerea T4]|uniref:Uncharacterized protein n=1 Tax=Botryotinia fuckeliana (strain T4) TaxID=999810 RepID=G2YE92_BOTF4|nr:hypothetical protein BofuT4_P024890.1 [Botrytis cinerea T4]